MLSLTALPPPPPPLTPISAYHLRLQIASLGNNVTLGIVAGISMKALNQSFDPTSTITLQQFIVIFGCIQLVLSQVGGRACLRAGGRGGRQSA